MKPESIIIHVPISLARQYIPNEDKSYYDNIVRTYAKTWKEFIIINDLVINKKSIQSIEIDKFINYLSDFKSEYHEFIALSPLSRWLSSCDKKTERQLISGIERNAVIDNYRDVNYLEKMLQKFHKKMSI